MPLIAKNRGEKLALKPNEKSSITHHIEKNSMASQTQTIVGKGKPNLLIAENLLKILRDLILPFSLKSLTNSLPWNGRITEGCINFPNEMSYR